MRYLAAILLIVSVSSVRLYAQDPGSDSTVVRLINLLETQSKEIVASSHKQMIDLTGDLGKYSTSIMESYREQIKQMSAQLKSMDSLIVVQMKSNETEIGKIQKNIKEQQDRITKELTEQAEKNRKGGMPRSKKEEK